MFLLYLTFSFYVKAPVQQRPPIRIFKNINSRNEFVPLIYYNNYMTLSTICGSTGDMISQSMGSYMCSLYGASFDDDDMTYYWSTSGWDNWGADYYTGNHSQYGMGMGGEVGSADVFVYDTNDIAMDWMISSATDMSCLDQSKALAVKCGESEFCRESGQSCAMDLDCCQSPDDPMYCQPSWGRCVYTV